MRTRKRLGITLALVARLGARCALGLVVLLTGCSLTNRQTRVDSFTVGASPRLEADVEISRLMVRAGDAVQVRVETTLRHARQTDYRVSQEGDTIRVSVRMQQGFSAISLYEPVEITITVPPTSDLVLTSSSGYVYVSGVAGHSTLTSSSGGVQVSDSEGILELSTQTGSVVCRRTRGDVQIRSDIGHVDLTDASGTFDIVTETGPIHFEGQLTTDKPHRFASSSGEIDLRLLGSPDLTVDAYSQAGTVRCMVEMTTTASARTLCKGVIGAGVGKLEVQTSTGAITIR